MIHPFHLLDDGSDGLVLSLGIVGLFEIAVEEEGDGLIEPRGRRPGRSSPINVTGNSKAGN